MSTIESGERVVMRRAFRGMWTYLPVLLAGSILVCAVSVLVVLIAPGITPVSVLLIAALVVPAFGALVGVANGIVMRGDSRMRAWGSALVTGWWLTTRLAAAPAVAIALCLVAREVWQRTSSPLALVPVGIAIVVSGILTLGLAAALPLALERRQLRGIRLWASALYLVAKQPIPFVAVICAAAMGVWAATAFSASLLLLVPAPLALLCSAATWSTAAKIGLHDAAADATDE